MDDPTGQIARAVELLAAGEVVGLPTETVYGLAADGLNSAAVAKIFQVKGRPSGHPLILHLGQQSDLERFASEVPERARLLAEQFWPGPLTMILPRAAVVPDAVTGGLETVGLRMPRHPVALEVIRRLGRPLAAPSANRFGGVSPTRREHVETDLAADVPLVLDGGESEVGVESTIVDLTGAEPKILRPGAVTRSQLEAVLRCAVEDDDGSGPAAPGTLESHYAPEAEVHVVDQSQLWEQVELAAHSVRVGVIFQSTPPEGLARNVLLERLAPGAKVLAHELYAALRRLDAAGCVAIFSTCPTESGLAEAVRDRLARAAAPRCR